ncbi:MAG TPA: hypothetical protein VGR11_14605 [Solirubrobacteraceae bacterium]|nr:hypothetical protein [Solirubrobacteraceae bacterium]
MSAGETGRWGRRLRRAIAVPLLVVLVLWIAVVVLGAVTGDDGFLYVPYGDYVTTVSLTEYRGSGCGRSAEIWTARDLADLTRKTVEVCDRRVWSSARVGDVLRVGTRNAVTRVTDAIVLFSLLAILPMVLVMYIVKKMLLPRDG